MLNLFRRGYNNADEPEQKGAHRRIARNHNRDAQDKAVIADQAAAGRRRTLRGTGIFGTSKPTPAKRKRK